MQCGAGQSEQLGRVCLVAFGPPQRFVVGLNIVVPMRSGENVAGIEFPPLIGNLQTRFQPLLLFVAVDVQVELENRRAFIGQESLEGIDVIEAFRKILCIRVGDGRAELQRIGASCPISPT